MEVCVDSIESALAAEAGGAHRLELCAALSEGGVTPSLGLFLRLKQVVRIPIFVLIRVRGGDFCYSPDEVEAMCADIRELRGRGADGFVIGALTESAELDMTAIDAMMAAATGDSGQRTPLTLHRCIDLCANPVTAAVVAARKGFTRILTSGGAASALSGVSTIAQIVQALASLRMGEASGTETAVATEGTDGDAKAGGASIGVGCTVMAGAGVTLGNAMQIVGKSDRPPSRCGQSHT